jgi:hypothetical protein
MHRFESLPDEFRAWLRGIPKERVHALLQSSIERRAAQRGLTIEPTNLLTAINKLDERYFSADEEGRKAEATEFFKQARMLAALQFSLEGTEEDALYEYFHSLDVDTSEAAIAELEND